MPVVCICPQGHRWKHPGGEPAPACPTCGSAAASVNEDTGPEVHHAETLTFAPPPPAVIPADLPAPPQARPAAAPAPQTAAPLPPPPFSTGRPTDLPKSPFPASRPAAPAPLPPGLGLGAGVQSPGTAPTARPGASPTAPPQEKRTLSWLAEPARQEPPPRPSGGILLPVLGTAAVCAALAALAWFIWLGPALDDANEEKERQRVAAETARKEAEERVKKADRDLADERKAHDQTRDDLKTEKEEREDAENKLKGAELKAQDADRRIREADNKARTAQGQLKQHAGSLKAEQNKTRMAEAQVARAQNEAYAERLALADLERTYRAPDRGEAALMRCPPPQRGWEWRYLYGQVNTERYAFHPHDDFTTALAYSPDGSRIASAGLDKAVRVWDAPTGKLLVTCTGHTRPVTGLAFSPDGKRLVSCDSGGKGAPGEGEVRVWEADTGKHVRTLACPGAVQAVALAADGRIAAACASGAVKLWDAAGKELPGPAAPAKGAPVNAVAFSPDGTLLAWGGGVLPTRPTDKLAPAAVNLWDARNGQEVLALAGHPAPVLSLVFQPDGKRLVSSDVVGQVRVWDPAARKASPPLHTVSLGRGGRSPLAVATDNRHAYAGSGDGSLWCLDLETGKPDRRYVGDPRGVLAVAVHPSGKRLATAEGDKLVHVRDLKEPPACLTCADRHNGAVDCLVVSPDGEVAASAGADRKVRLWDLRTGRPLRTPLEGLSRPAAQLLFSPDGARLVAVSRPAPQADKSIEVLVWDTATGKKVAEVPGRSGETLFAGFGPDGKRLLLTSPGEKLLVWDLTTRKSVEQLDDLPGSPKAGAQADCLAATPDGTWVALAGRNGLMVFRRVPDAAGLKWQLTPFKTPQPATGLIWSPQGAQLGLAFANGIHVWDLVARRVLGNWQLTQPDIRTVALGPSGRRLFAGVGSSTVKVWELTGSPANRLLLSLPVPQHGPVTCVARGADTRRVLAGTADGAILIWDADPRGGGSEE